MNNGMPFEGVPMQGYNFQPFTNVTFVMSLEEALFRASQRNSDMVFFNQDKTVFYRVKVDADGKKSWLEFTYTLANQEDNTPVTRKDIQSLQERLTALEKSMNGGAENA